jgi:formate--tetrahydrofolate ligase
MQSDIEIAEKAAMQPIGAIAAKLGLQPDDFEQYGKFKAKIALNVAEQRHAKPNGRLILVSAITPTKAGEGKSTVTLGLTDGLNALGVKAAAAIREPSMGPVFGLKGGAAGGGYAQAVPMADLNLHFTGDFHAVTSAHNLIAAVLDNHIYQGNALGIDAGSIVWKRTLDMNDRELRAVKIGLNGKTNGITRDDSFQITAASEIMAVLCLCTSVSNLRERLEKIIVAYNINKVPVTVKDLGITGSLLVLLKDAVKPNLIQTLEGSPVFVHGGPFANIAHGCNSIIATQTALKLADYVVTEAGFATELGAEKFFDIKCRYGGFMPDAVVIVATIRALKMHGGADIKALADEDRQTLTKGLVNLKKHIENIAAFGIKPLVALNNFSTDTAAEREIVERFCYRQGVKSVVFSGYAEGSSGAKNLAQAVIEACEMASSVHYLYELSEPLKQKIEKLATVLYGAGEVVYSNEALQKIMWASQQKNLSELPLCVAKTADSLSDSAKLKGAPTGFQLHVNNIKVAAGAGFIIVYCGAIIDMPGLPAHPAALEITMDDNGRIKGLF